jgi:hypothetical protein
VRIGARASERRSGSGHCRSYTTTPTPLTEEGGGEGRGEILDCHSTPLPWPRSERGRLVVMVQVLRSVKPSRERDIVVSAKSRSIEILTLHREPRQRMIRTLVRLAALVLKYRVSLLSYVRLKRILAEFYGEHCATGRAAECIGSYRYSPVLVWFRYRDRYLAHGPLVSLTRVSIHALSTRVC